MSCPTIWSKYAAAIDTEASDAATSPCKTSPACHNFFQPVSSRSNAASNSFIASSFFLFLSSSFSSFRFLASSCNFLAERGPRSRMSAYYSCTMVYYNGLPLHLVLPVLPAPDTCISVTSSCQHSQHPDPESFCFLFLSLLFFTRCNSCQHVFYFLVGLVD